MNSNLKPSDRSMRYLERLAKETGKTPSAVLDAIIVAYRGQRIADELASYTQERLQFAEGDCGF